MANRMSTPEKPWLENYARILKDSVSEHTGKPKVIGSVGTPRDGPAGAEIGYGLYPDYWGKGYMSEALKLFIGIYWGPGSTFTLDFFDFFSVIFGLRWEAMKT